jgi:tmRNA-binding protein
LAGEPLKIFQSLSKDCMQAAGFDPDGDRAEAQPPRRVKLLLKRNNPVHTSTLNITHASLALMSLRLYLGKAECPLQRTSCLGSVEVV